MVKPKGKEKVSVWELWGMILIDMFRVVLGCFSTFVLFIFICLKRMK